MKKIIIISTILLILSISSCNSKDNTVLYYLNNSDLQFENEMQHKNIEAALIDILNLSELDLKLQRYWNYTGKEKVWDLPTLIYKHFLAHEIGLNLGNNFYKEVKSKKVLDRVSSILYFLNNSHTEDPDSK